MAEDRTENMLATRERVALGIYVGVLNFALMGVIIALWPVAGVPESRYLLCAAASGALGSYIHLATSFVEHAGRRRLLSSWAWWYVLRPWIGSALALVVYFVLRAGLIAGASESGTAMNPYGVAAISALSGMFSAQATNKLREIFENICAVERRSEKVQ